MSRFIAWIRDFFWDDEEELYGVDDPHDPQVLTRVYGNAIEMGDFKQ